MTPRRTTRLSLCMIVRDEEKALPQCLAAARPHVDEICIVDTGSKDRSVAIAQSFGAKVKSIEWPDSFAAARNASLEMASGDWILFLDADEVLRADTVWSLRDIVGDERMLGAHLRFINHYDGKKPIDCLILRLFRNAPEHRFTGAIHEQVLDSLLATQARSGGRIVDTNVTVDHYGYKDAVRDEKKKDERNRILFEAAVAAEPANVYLRFKYADFLRKFKDAEKTLLELDRTVALLDALPESKARSLSFAGEAYALYALELARAGRLTEADRVLAKGASRSTPTATYHWMRGHVDLRLERFGDALVSFERCRALDGKTAHMPAQPGVTGPKAWFGRARALLGLGQAEEASRLFLEGAALWPEDRDLGLAAAKIEASVGSLQDALERLMKHLEADRDDAEFWEVGAAILLELNVLDRAETWAERALAKPETAAGAAAIVGECRLARGALEAALESFGRHPDDPRCIVGLTLLYLLADEPLPEEWRGEFGPHVTARRRILRRLVRTPEGEKLVRRCEDAARRYPRFGPAFAEDMRALVTLRTARG